MDSLSQIVLGSAVAEVVAGKKLGNKAILWGAVAGTIPDLDIITHLFLEEFHAMSLHRGFSHSIVFCLVASPLFAWIWMKSTPAGMRSIRWITNFVAGRIVNPMMKALGSAKRSKLYDGAYVPKMTWKAWTALFFWCFITHIALDCLTTWGTQIFWPFDIRVSTNSIFVADPLYTLPFLLFLIVAMFFRRTSGKRRVINRLGLIISTSYLALGFVFKKIADSAFEESFAAQNIEVVNYESRPSPLNIILWQVNVETADGYMMGFYSLFDEDSDVRYHYEPKQHELLDPLKGDPTLEKVLHMTTNYYTVEKTDSMYIVNDLRFGHMDGYAENPEHFVFRYFIYPRDGQDVFVDVQDPPDPKPEELSMAVSQIWKRMMGDKTPMEVPEEFRLRSD